MRHHIAAMLLAGSAFALYPLHARQEPSAATTPEEQNWTHRVRIAGYGLGRRPPSDIVRDATDSHVFGIEVDNDITGRYESFLDPDVKLADIRALASEAHAAGNRAFVYIAGTECITKDADSNPHTLAKDHPDWLQRKRSGEPAIFTGGAAFWIRKGDEDVWISPYAAAWREQYMTRVRQIAATGIDGIYVDIPYWMTHFDGWEDSWASFDDYTVEAFRRKTGLDARRDLDVGNFADPHFRRWIDFRIETITDFMREIDRNAKAVNPAIMTIPEIYPGIERAAVVVGADVYQLYGVTDAIAHEYEIGGGNHMATSRTPLDWFRYQVGHAHLSRICPGQGYAGSSTTPGTGTRHIAPPEPMMNLAMSVVMAGRELLGRGHPRDVGLERPAHSQADLRVDRETREDALRAARAGSPDRGVLFAGHAELLPRRVHTRISGHGHPAAAGAPGDPDRHAAHAGGISRSRR